MVAAVVVVGMGVARAVSAAVLPRGFQGVLIVTIPKARAVPATGFMARLTNAAKRSVGSAVIDKIQTKLCERLDAEGVVYDVLRAGDNSSLTFHINNAFDLVAARKGRAMACLLWLATDVTYLVLDNLVTSVRGELDAARVVAQVRAR